MPPGTPTWRIRRLLRDRASWLERQLRRAAEIERRPDALGLNRPGHVWHRGTPLPIVAHRARRARADVRDGVLRAVGPSSAAAHAAVERWYRREARAEIAAIVAERSALMDLQPAAISIRDQRGRWGSCSSTGRLSFNWRLMLAPTAVRDYLVVHELAHLRHPNHSSDFWRAVADVLPEWREHDRWLSRHGRELLRYRIVLTPGDVRNLDSHPGERL